MKDHSSTDNQRYLCHGLHYVSSSPAVWQLILFTIGHFSIFGAGVCLFSINWGINLNHIYVLEFEKKGLFSTSTPQNKQLLGIKSFIVKLSRFTVVYMIIYRIPLEFGKKSMFLKKFLDLAHTQKNLARSSGSRKNALQP